MGVAVSVTPALAVGAIGASTDSSLPAPLPAFEQLVEQQRAEQQDFEQALQSPSATADREDSQTAFETISDGEAQQVFAEKFGDLLASDARFPVDPAQVKSYLSDHVAVVEKESTEESADAQDPDPVPTPEQSPAEPGAEQSDSGTVGPSVGLVDSTLPLRTADDQGDRAPVDLTLKNESGTFAPTNPLVDTALPVQLGDGLHVGGIDGIGIQLAGADSSSEAKRVGDTSLIYPNVEESRDLVASARPTGLELSTQVRSLDASETERFQFELPEGAELQSLPDGSIAVVRVGEALGRVDPPQGIDAQGQPVPVSMRVDGPSSIVVEAEFHGGDYALPILIDPVIESYTSGNLFSVPPAGVWPISQTANSPFVVCPGPNGGCSGWAIPYISAPTGSYPAMSSGAKVWNVPNGTSNPDSTTAWIQSASFGNVTYAGNPSQTNAPMFMAAIINTRTGAGNAGQVNAGNQGFSGSTFTLTPSGSYPGPVDDGQQIWFGLFDYTGSATNHSTATAAYDFGGITINTTDPEDPVNDPFQNNTIPSTWVRDGSGPYSLGLPARDPGLGVYKEWMFLPKIGGGVDLGEPVMYDNAVERNPSGCTGARTAACPPSYTGNFTISSSNISSMPEGRSKIIFWTLDPLGNIFAPENGHNHIAGASTEIRVDRSGPKLTLSNTLADAVEDGGDLDAQKSYDLHVLARDGSTQSPNLERSGVRSVDLFLNDLGHHVGPTISNPSCPNSSCEGSLDYHMDVPALLASGALHTGNNSLIIVSTDFATDSSGNHNQTVRTLDLTVQGHAGVIVTPKSGDTTARRFGLLAERRDPSMTNVTFQYRWPGGHFFLGPNNWRNIPTDELTLDSDGTHPTSTLLSLDANGRSPAITWDVPPTPGNDGKDGPINIRARFSNGPPSNTSIDQARDNAALFWRLGEAEGKTAFDSSGNARHGTYVGQPVMNQPGATLLGADDDGAVDLNRPYQPQQFVKTDYDPFVSAATQTFSGWAKRTNGSGWDTVFGGDDLWQEQKGPRLMLGPMAFGLADVSWRPDGSAYGGPSANWSNAWPRQNDWVHWALIWNEATSTAELFIDGQSKGAQQIVAVDQDNPIPLVVGAWGDGDTFGDVFHGSIDEFAVFDYGLSASDILALKQNGPEKGYSQVVPLTLDRDTTSSKHASAPIGPGTLDLQTGNFAVTADDVKVDSWGSDLTVSRTFNSRQPTVGVADWATYPFGPGWISSVPVDSAGSDYIQLAKTGPSGDAGAQITVTTSDTTEIRFSRAANGSYNVEPMYTGLELQADGAQFVLKEIDGSSTTFYQPSGSQLYAPLKVTQTGAAAQNTTRIGYQLLTGGDLSFYRVKSILAPTPAGVNCPEIGSTGEFTLNRGCRALTFHYTDNIFVNPEPGEYGPSGLRLDHISLNAWDPESGQMKETVVEQYNYDQWGRLHAAWDPRIGNSKSCSPQGGQCSDLKTVYTYDTQASTGHLKQIAPAGQNANPWTFNYASPQPDDPNKGRLASVARNIPGVGTATTTVAYDVSLSSPWPMTPSNVAQWHQTDLPTQATAIIPPNPTSGATQSDLHKATIYYMNRNGDLVNQANPSTTTQGEISTTQYDGHRNPVRALTAQNRLTALAAGTNSIPTADVLETDNVYSSDGVDLLETFGPEHQIQLVDGSLEEARKHSVTSYDDGRPTGQDYHLPTKQVTGARVCSGLDCPMTPGSESDVETRTTTTDYDWTLRQPTRVTIDPGTGTHLNLVARSAYDSATGLTTSTSTPKANADGSDAHTTKTIYYSAQGQSPDPNCRNKPEWANLPCKIYPAGQPGGSAPSLPTTWQQKYDIWDQPRAVVQMVPGSGETRTTTTTYDDAGRPTTTAVSAAPSGSNVGAPVPTVTTTYSAANGQVATTSDGTRTISRLYDPVGRIASYTDADGRQTTTQYGDLNGPTHTAMQVGTGTASTDIAYDPTTGRVTTLADSQAGSFSAGYDADGNLLTEAMPGNITLFNTYDSAGDPISREYLRNGASVMLFGERESIHGQVTSETTSVNGTQTESNAEVYDAGGRLVQSRDSTPSDGCAVQNYTYDGDSNRASQRSSAAIPGGVCDSDPNHGTLASHTYDDADRLLSSGAGNNYSYDAFGRTLTVPAADAGGQLLTATYYRDDRVQSMTQGGVTKMFLYDPSGRVRQTQTSGQSDRIDHFSDDSDSPSWSETGSNWTRSIAGVDGSLSAIQSGSGATNGALTYELTNMHGDVVGETNSGGQLQQTFRADEFGVPQGSQPSTGYGWLGGKERRSQFASGVTTMGERVYVPEIGRFLQVDPVSGGSANDYDYAYQDPVNSFDLDGTKPRGRPKTHCNGYNFLGNPPPDNPRSVGPTTGPGPDPAPGAGNGVGVAVPFNICIQKLPRGPGKGTLYRAVVKFMPPHDIDELPMQLQLVLYRNKKMITRTIQHDDTTGTGLNAPHTKWKTPWVRTHPGHFCVQLQNQYDLNHYQVFGQVGHDPGCGNHGGPIYQ